LRHQWNLHSMGFNILFYKYLWIDSRDIQHPATLQASSHDERVLCHGIKALKTNISVAERLT